MRSRAFTLVEIIIVMSIAALLLAVSVPVISAWMGNRTLATNADKVASDIRRAIIDAQKYGITPVPTSDPGGSNPYDNGGYEVVNGNPSAPTQPSVVRKQTLDSTTIRLSPAMTGVTGVTAGRALLFFQTASGQVQVVGGFAIEPSGQVAPGGQVLLKNSSKAYMITVNPQGMVREDAVDPTTVPQDQI